MPADLVTRIAGESEENRAQREQLSKQLDVLMKGSDTCKRFIGVRLLGKKASTVFLSRQLLMYWIDVDDGTIQLDLKFNAANNNSDNFDVTSDDPIQEEARPLSDRSISCRSSPLEEFKVESGWETPGPEFSVVSEVDVVKAPDEEVSYSSKKKSKKSKIWPKQAIFE